MLRNVGIIARRRYCVSGFALPTILIASVVMLMALTSAIGAVVSSRNALNEQYYNRLTKEAAESGLAKAQACLRLSAGVVTWSNDKPLKPETDCSGNSSIDCTSRPLNPSCAVLYDAKDYTTFSIGEPTYIDGKVDQVVANATASRVRASTKEVWGSFSTSIRLSAEMLLQKAWSINGQIVAGHSHTCAMVEGSMWCWGSGYYGQIGNGTFSSTNIPKPIVADGELNGKAITYIAAGGSYNGSAFGTTCVVAGGNPYCWGLNNYGQVGNNTPNATGSNANLSTAQGQATPTAVITGVLPVNTTQRVAVGGYSSCAVTGTSGLYCWGKKSSGYTTVPEKVSDSTLIGKNITDIAMNVNEGVCVVASGTVYCTTSGFGPYTAITSGSLAGKTVKKITWAGTSSRCALTTDGLVSCWGNNGDGQLGNGTTTTASVPTPIYMYGDLAGKTIIDIAGGSSGTVCAIASDYQVYCWGNGAWGLLGQGPNDTADVLNPKLLAKPSDMSGKSLISIVASYAHACALDTTGQAYCWGGFVNDYGQLGYGSKQLTKGLPISVVNPNPESKRPGFFF